MRRLNCSMQLNLTQAVSQINKIWLPVKTRKQRRIKKKTSQILPRNSSWRCLLMLKNLDFSNFWNSTCSGIMMVLLSLGLQPISFQEFWVRNQDIMIRSSALKTVWSMVSGCTFYIRSWAPKSLNWVNSNLNRWLCHQNLILNLITIMRFQLSGKSIFKRNLFLIW